MRKWGASRETLGEWMETWMRDYAVHRIKTSTRTSYENAIGNQITPHLGRLRLKNVTRIHINEFYQTLLRSGRADGTGGLSIKSIRNIHIVLHRALRDAVSCGKIQTNPASGADIPTYRGSQMKNRPEALSLSEQRALTALCGTDAVGTAVVMALSTGLRMGELLGLRWADVDLAAGTISVSHQLSRLKDYRPGAPAKTRLAIEDGAKTNASLRVIPIDKTLAGRLRDYKNAQTGILSAQGGAIPSDMVFTGRKGGFLDPAVFRYQYRLLLKEAGLKRHTVHALRHTFATRALEAGVPVKAVSQILGHTESTITLDIYSHVMPAFQAEVMTRIAQYVCGDMSSAVYASQCGTC